MVDARQSGRCSLKFNIRVFHEFDSDADVQSTNNSDRANRNQTGKHNEIKKFNILYKQNYK